MELLCHHWQRQTIEIESRNKCTSTTDLQCTLDGANSTFCLEQLSHMHKRINKRNSRHRNLIKMKRTSIRVRRYHLEAHYHCCWPWTWMRSNRDTIIVTVIHSRICMSSVHLDTLCTAIHLYTSQHTQLGNGKRSLGIGHALDNAKSIDRWSKTGSLLSIATNVFLLVASVSQALFGDSKRFFLLLLRFKFVWNPFKFFLWVFLVDTIQPKIIESTNIWAFNSY